MDYARKLLEKYGWTDGKGLGKNENGMAEALKPKLKRSVTGVGHDAASDFTEHWWTKLYNKAAENVQVQDKNGKTKQIKTTSDTFKITNNMWQLEKPNNADNETDNKEAYSNYFVKKAILTSGGAKTEKLNDSDTESEDEPEKKDLLAMTDEELFAACGGRTAHKGARHGLKATGKLARIERQEMALLNLPKYVGYSHGKKPKRDVILDDTNLASDSDVEVKKRKKKRKHCVNKEIDDVSTVNEIVTDLKDGADVNLNVDTDKTERKKKKKVKSCIINETNADAMDEEPVRKSCDTIDTKVSVKKSKKSKRKSMDEVNNDSNKTSKKKKKVYQESAMDVDAEIIKEVRKKKKNIAMVT